MEAMTIPTSAHPRRITDLRSIHPSPSSTCRKAVTISRIVVMIFTVYFLRTTVWR
jgi:hypothetical protein